MCGYDGPWKKWLLRFSTLCRCGGLERNNFLHFILCLDVMVLKEVTFNIFYFVWIWWSWKNWFETVSTLGRLWWSWKNWFLTFSTLYRRGVLERTDFNHSLFCVDVMVLKNRFLTFSTLCGCGGLERRDF